MLWILPVNSRHPLSGLPPIKVRKGKTNFGLKTVTNNVPILRGWERSRPLSVSGWVRLRKGWILELDWKLKTEGFAKPLGIGGFFKPPIPRGGQGVAIYGLTFVAFMSE